MGNIRKILIAVRKFTPDGQNMVMKILKENRSYMKEREFAFADLPQILSGQGRLKEVENQLINPNNSVRDIIVSLLKTKRHRIKIAPEILQEANSNAFYKLSQTQEKSLMVNFHSKQKQITKILDNYP